MLGKLCKPRFYSILVRLKVGQLPVSYLLHNGFYSILVRLKVVYDRSRVKGPQFLFHTGSIKSLSTALRHLLTSSFYSILVRLKAPAKPDAQVPPISRFYSILVRLKVTITAYVQSPTMFVSIPYWFD